MIIGNYDVLRALETIRNHCDKTLFCATCPFCKWDEEDAKNVCILTKNIPRHWKIEEVEE